jgi:hypothetical protein
MIDFTQTLPTPNATTLLKRVIAEADPGYGLSLMDLSRESGMRIVDVSKTLEHSPDDFHSEKNDAGTIFYTLNNR